MRNVTHASGADVDKVIQAIEENTAEFPRKHVVMACLAYSLWLMYPDLTPEDIFEGVNTLSHQMCDFIGARYPELETVPKEKLN